MYSVDGFQAAHDKWVPRLRDLNDDELSVIAIGLAYKMVMPAWYHKDQLETMVDQSISEEAFRGFLRYIEKSDIDSHVGDLVVDYWKAFCEEHEEEYVEECEDK